MAFTSIPCSGLHKSLKERDIHNSINGKSIPDFRFPDIYYYLVEKMAIMKTFYCHIEVWGFLLIF